MVNAWITFTQEVARNRDIFKVSDQYLIVTRRRQVAFKAKIGIDIRVKMESGQVDTKTLKLML